VRARTIHRRSQAGLQCTELHASVRFGFEKKNLHHGVVFLFAGKEDFIKSYYNQVKRLSQLLGNSWITIIPFQHLADLIWLADALPHEHHG
jgi:hypothetical protein